MTSQSHTAPPGDLEHAECPLCRDAATRERHRRADRYGDDDRAWAVVQCTHCGLMYVDPRPTPEAIGHYYPDTYSFHEAEPDEGPVPLPERLETAYRHHLLRFEARQMRRLTGRTEGRVLDVGCAAGDRLAILKRMGYEPAGVETSPEAERARRLGFDVWRGTVETSHFEPASFEIVMLYNVLEHVHDPGAVVNRLHELLAPGGHLLVQVPNRRSVQARVFGARWAAMDVPRDLYYYDRDTLHRLVKPHGFELHGFTTHTSYLHPPTLVLSCFPGLDPRLIWAERTSGRLSLVKRGLWGMATLGLAPFAWAEGLAGLGASMTAVWRKA